jgi:sec-independent protein translocase protein TatB
LFCGILSKSGMFDIGFSELVVIGLVALVVLGPERLPRVARTLGHLAGRLQRYVSDVKSDISREMEIEDLKKLKDSMQEAATSFETSVRSEAGKVESELGSTAGELNKTAEALAEPKADAAKPADEAKAPEDKVPEVAKSSEAKHG